MNIQDFKKEINKEIQKVDDELYGEMVINWQLEGEKAAYKKVKELMSQMVEETFGEIMQQMTPIEIANRARLVCECYDSPFVYEGHNYYDINIVEDAFTMGAKWILAQLKV